MPTLSSEVYNALRSIGIDEPQAQSAASAMTAQREAFDDLKREIAVLKWMVGANTALTLLVLGKLLLGH